MRCQRGIVPLVIEQIWRFPLSCTLWALSILWFNLFLFFCSSISVSNKVGPHFHIMEQRSLGKNYLK